MDAVDFYTFKLVLKKNQTNIFSYSFFSAGMAAVPYAHVVAKIIWGKHPKGTDSTDVSFAPDVVCFILRYACFVIFHFVLLRFGEYGQSRCRICL